MAELNRTTYIWAFELCEIMDAKIQVKLFKLAKDLSISEWDMLNHLDNLPDVSNRKTPIIKSFIEN
jgi:hypothetical protein